MKRVLTTLVGVFGLAVSARAQYASWSVSVTYGGGATSLSPENPVARIRVTATFGVGYLVGYGWSDFDMVATEAGWVGVQAFPVLHGPNTPGVVIGGVVNNVRTGQIHFPPTILANPANPMLVWEMDWTTSSFRPRSVDLSMTTRRFRVHTNAPWSHGWYYDFIPSTVTGGQGSIAITPAPSGFVLLGLSGLVLTLRRR